MNVIWITVSFNYYMLSFLLKYFPGNIFINGMANSLSELFSNIISGMIYKNTGPKRGFIFSFLISALGGLSILLYEIFTGFFKSEKKENEGALLFAVLVLIAKFGIGSASNICYISNSDIFPVLFSASGFGICQFIARGLTSTSSLLAEV